MSIRINKYLSEIGLCSRREADRWIEQGRVTINGKQPGVGAQVSSRDVIRVNGMIVESPDDDHTYLLFNKPPGIVTTTDTKEADNIVSYINYPRRIFPVGRLDKASEGLIILTSDGDVVNKILRAGNNHEKEYEVSVDKPLSADFADKMSNGVPILGQVTRKCKVEVTGSTSFKITLTQGLNRQIRRMCGHFGYEVHKLKRTRIMHLELDLPPGQFRDLSKAELDKLFNLIKDSKGTADEKPAKKKPAKKKPTKQSGPHKPKPGGGAKTRKQKPGGGFSAKKGKRHKRR
ncbi:23S rRNA pseudouridine(2604) synthase RluF [Phaeocystidibacter luteus]|uniref:Pseudouridine synthase n=1 Tax=Phaeocystidibacter luteus TaxID=911197 RepID=A0A6N6RHP7_9FLAO|nr:23S rRNA pseudouridine(2604) synthase RluF [Phaeocystidibacter luteus]KAB2809980.1 23S rRNA pseudouridine(2604) synthase RluF [Phaeocystidibacter luteus]